MTRDRSIWWLLGAALVYCLLCIGLAHAGPEWAVVRVSSHGGSGTVVWTGPGKTLILSAAHMFQGRDRTKKVTIDAPSPNPTPTEAAAVRVVAVDQAADLALLEMAAGPLPYCCPIAPAGHRPGRLLSCGYDEMTYPALQRPATLLDSDATQTRTRERPWHGRSGGGLIDLDSGTLVGVVSGYTGPSNHQELARGGWGCYASHAAILRFVGWRTTPAEEPIPAWPRPQVQAPAPGTGLPLTDGGWDGSLRQVPRPQGWNVRPGAPRVSEQRQPGPGVCLPGG